jgi:hypothetical protein
MTITLSLRRTVFAFVLGAALAATVLVGRAAHATTGEINACFKPSNGTLYLLGESSDRSECQPGDIPISWNSAGLNGQDGVSVTSEPLSPGDDAACPNGGSKFTAVDGVSYACNGANGQDGLDGVDGQDGEDFAGTFTSPNGLFKLIVDDTTAKLEGPGSKVQVTANSIQIQTPGLFSASGAVTAIGGTQILLNGSGCGLLRPTDVVPAVGPDGGLILLNPAGSPSVRTTC